MFRFRRKRNDPGSENDGPSLEEQEKNPELLAAEHAANLLPPPPPSSNVILDVYTGSRPQIVDQSERDD